MSTQIKKTQRVILDLDLEDLKFYQNYAIDNFMSRKKTLEMFVHKLANQAN